jgi:hypothetical protein
MNAKEKQTSVTEAQDMPRVPIQKDPTPVAVTQGSKEMDMYAEVGHDRDLLLHLRKNILPSKFYDNVYIESRE